jgi:short-subunit dehydrogenase
MAALGFNVCIVARNEDKISLKLEELAKEYPNVKRRAVIADFA